MARHGEARVDAMRLSLRQADLFIEAFETGAMLDDIEATIRILLTETHNELTIESEEGIAMRADLTKVRQTLFNQRSNAAKFTKDGTVSLTVERGRGSQANMVKGSTFCRPPSRGSHLGSRVRAGSEVRGAAGFGEGATRRRRHAGSVGTTFDQRRLSRRNDRKWKRWGSPRARAEAHRDHARRSHAFDRWLGRPPIVEE